MRDPDTETENEDERDGFREKDVRDDELRNLGEHIHEDDFFSERLGDRFELLSHPITDQDVAEPSDKIRYHRNEQHEDDGELDLEIRLGYKLPTSGRGHVQLSYRIEKKGHGHRRCWVSPRLQLRIQSIWYRAGRHSEAQDGHAPEFQIVIECP